MENEKMYLVSEENHGDLAITKTYEAAIYFLLEENWINDNYPYYPETGDSIPLKDYCLSLGYSGIEEYLLCNEDNFNDIFCDEFCIEELNNISTDTWRIG